MSQIFSFAFDPAVRTMLAPLGVWPSTAYVRVDDDWFAVRFGPWRLRTPRANVVDASLTGPYRWYRAVGVRLSLTDRGVTFGTNAKAGVCVQFADPVPGLLPTSLLRHPAATVTVAEPELLHRLLRRR